jgi:hypothetical protein
MHKHTDMTQSQSSADKLARGLGWLSLGVGLYQLLAPGRITRELGMQGSENSMSGIGALSDNPTPAIWSRVGGDVLDLAALSFALKDEHNPKKQNVYLALTAVGILTALDYACAKALSQRHAYQGGATPDYSYRSGFPQGLASARGAALGFQVPADMKDALPSPTL